MQASPNLRAIVVLFHPDDAAIEMVTSIAGWGYAPITVVNAIDAARLDLLRASGSDIVMNARNVGLAAAFNQGIDIALASGAGYVMLLDQDTRPQADLATAMIEIALHIEASGYQLGCIGPVPVDRKRPAARTMAALVGGQSAEPDFAEVVTVISSGMLIPRAALIAIGGMWNELFIDHVDHEWCFRARAAGLGVFAATSLPMAHDMGDEGFVLFGRYKPIHRSPIRHFYIVRNTLWLARCRFIPMKWRLVETAKLAIRVPGYVLFSARRGETLRSVVRAIGAGLRRMPERTVTALPPGRTSRSYNQSRDA